MAAILREGSVKASASPPSPQNAWSLLPAVLVWLRSRFDVREARGLTNQSGFACFRCCSDPYSEHFITLKESSAWQTAVILYAYAEHVSGRLRRRECEARQVLKTTMPFKLASSPGRCDVSAHASIAGKTRREAPRKIQRQTSILCLQIVLAGCSSLLTEGSRSRLPGYLFAAHAGTGHTLLRCWSTIKLFMSNDAKTQN